MPSPFRRVAGASQSITTRFDDKASFDESFRILRSNLDVALADMRSPTVIVTSPNPSEGKTLTSAHLAMSFAAAGRKVVLVDLDLRHPNAHRVVGGHNEFGASEVLLGKASAAEAMQFIEVPTDESRGRSGMYFLATGLHTADPAELLGSGRTAKLLDGLANQADVVLMDTPPVLPVADTLVIGRMSSGALLVAEARRTTLPAIQKAKDQLIRNQTRLLGIVFNKLQRKDVGYGFGYGYPSRPAEPPETELMYEEAPATSNGSSNH